MCKICHLLAACCLAHLSHVGEEFSDEVWGGGLVPVEALDPDTTGWVSATQLARLHCECRPVGVQSVEDMLQRVNVENLDICAELYHFSW